MFLVVSTLFGHLLKQVQLDGVIFTLECPARLHLSLKNLFVSVKEYHFPLYHAICENSTSSQQLLSCNQLRHKHQTHCWNSSCPFKYTKLDGHVKNLTVLVLKGLTAPIAKVLLTNVTNPFRKRKWKSYWSHGNYCDQPPNALALLKNWKVLPSESILVIEKSISDNNDCENQSICSPCMFLKVAKVK